MAARQSTEWSRNTKQTSLIIEQSVIIPVVNFKYEGTTINSSTTEDPIILSAARWFWWIAALSLVNTVLFLSGSNTSFVVGLSMTAIVSALFSSQIAIVVVLTAVLLGFYFLMGLFAQREKAWAFYVGLAMYVADALIFVKFEDWMSVAFHAYASYCMVQGILRLRQNSQLPAAIADKAEAGV